MANGTGPFDVRRNTLFNQIDFNRNLGYNFGAIQEGRQRGYLDSSGRLVGGFDQDRFFSDPEYRRFIEDTYGRNSESAEVFNQLRQIDELQEAASQRTDLQPIFGPLGEKIDEQAAQSLQSQQAQLSRTTQRAEQRATEALAGTGLGRSGVAAQGFSDIGRAGVEASERVTANVEAQRMQAQMDLAFKQAQIQYAEELRAMGFTQDAIKDAIAFDRELYAMQFQADLAEQQSSFFDDFLAVLEVGSNFVSPYQIGG